MDGYFSLKVVVRLVCFAWLFAELFVARVAGGDRMGGPDRFSYPILWATCLLAMALAVGLGRQPIGRIHAETLCAAFGLVLLGVGIAIRFTAIWTLRRFFTVRVTIQDDHRLIRRGLYRWIRHPSYLGVLVGLAGVAVSLSNFLSILALLIPITIAVLYRIKVEEAALRSRFGREYETYTNSTRLLVPFIY